MGDLRAEMNLLSPFPALSSTLVIDGQLKKLRKNFGLNFGLSVVS